MRECDRTRDAATWLQMLSGRLLLHYLARQGGAAHRHRHLILRAGGEDGNRLGDNSVQAAAGSADGYLHEALWTLRPLLPVVYGAVCLHRAAWLSHIWSATSVLRRWYLEPGRPRKVALDYSGAGGEIVLFTGKRTDIEETRIALNHTSKIRIGAIRAFFYEM